MATIIVPASGASAKNATLNDTLQVDPSVDINSIPVNYDLNGATILKSLFIGYDLTVTVNDSLTGTGNVTGASDATVGNLPLLDNANVFDVNGAIDVNLNNEYQINVSSGEQLDVEGDLFSLGTITVASGGTLVLNSVASAFVQQISLSGTLIAEAPLTTLNAATPLSGSIVVRGDAKSSFGNGTAQLRSGTTGGAYVAVLDMRAALPPGPIASLALQQDAEVQLGTGSYTVQRLSVQGVATAMMPLDILQITADSTGSGVLTVTGDGSTAAGQALLSNVFISKDAGKLQGGTVDLKVAAAQGGASLQNTVKIDAGTTLRNDAVALLGGGAGTTTIGATSAAAGSLLINAAGATMTVGGGATVNVATLQNLGTIDITAGTLALTAAVTGNGAVIVENGAALSLGNASSFSGSLQLKGSAGLDLLGVAASSAKVTGGKIVVTTASGTFGLAETGLTEGATFTVASDKAGGTTLSLSTGTGTGGGSGNGTATPVSHPPVYRFFSKVDGTHFFTASAFESTNVQMTRSDLNYEGTGLLSYNSTDTGATAVFRFLDKNTGTHFYTSSTIERDSVLQNRSDLGYEGVGFYEHATQQSGDVAVVRYLDTVHGTHFYTSSTVEQAAISANRTDLKNEGVSFYAPTT